MIIIMRGTDKLVVLKRIAIFAIRIFDIKTNEYPIILFINNILKLTDYKPNYHQNRLQKHIKSVFNIN